MDSDEHARSTCGVLDLRQQLVRRCVWQWMVAGSRRQWFVGADRRRGFGGAAPAMMVVTRRGSTNTTLAAIQRHPCRCGMVTADCARSRSRPESVVASGGTEGIRRKLPALTQLLTTRAREALMMAGAGGAMPATGRRATAIRFQQFGEGGSDGIARLSGRRARGQR